MPVLGRYGDTHVAPAVLFDVDDPSAIPPQGSIDVQFRVPVSLSAMLDGMAQADLRPELNAWGHGYSALVSRLLTNVQETGGYAITHGDTAMPARLELAAVIETAVPGFDQHRWHCHVYVGPTATTLHDGERRPTARAALARKMSSLAYPFYKREVEALAARELLVEWGEPRPGAEREIVDPPWHEHVGANERGICDGPWGRRGDVVLPDEIHLRSCAEAEVQIQRDRAAGYTSEPDWRAVRAEAWTWPASGVTGRAQR